MGLCVLSQVPFSTGTIQHTDTMVKCNRVYTWYIHGQYVFVCILQNMILLYWYIFKDALTLFYKEGVYSCHYIYHNCTHGSYNYCLDQQQILNFWATNCLVLSKNLVWILFYTSSWLMIVSANLGTHEVPNTLLGPNYIYIANIVSNIVSWLKRPFYLYQIPFYFLYNKSQRECALIRFDLK